MATNTNRTKGHNAERYYAKAFKDLGFSHCITARYGSRVHDDAGIDLINLPFNPQIKAGYKSLNYRKELIYLEDRIKELFPPDHEVHKKINVLIHKKDREKGRKKRISQDELVTMSFKDFVRIIKMIDKWE